MDCLYCGKELPYSALRVKTSFASKKRMHRVCARKALQKAARLDYKLRKSIKRG